MFETSSESPAPVRVVSEAIKDYVDRLGPIWIEGEISELNERSGMMAFMRLRDTSVDMSISVMCHKSVIATVKPLPDNARVVLYAKPSFYTKNGSLSFSAREIRQVGVGELLARLEALKNLLAGEGLFDSDRKVALRELEANKDVEVIIITRGGGSFEDLLPFSDEGLVRLAASCSTPIVSAIGHEKDAPLLDLVADYRASTPTDAAKRVVPDIAEEIAMISAMRDRARRTLVNRINLEATQIANFKNRPVMKDPHVLITSRAEIIAGLRDRSNRSFGASLKLAKEELKQIKARVRALSPQSTLDRGYSVVQLADGQIVTDPKKVKAGDELRLRLAKGETKATALGN